MALWTFYPTDPLPSMDAVLADRVLGALAGASLVAALFVLLSVVLVRLAGGVRRLPDTAPEDGLPSDIALAVSLGCAAAAAATLLGLLLATPVHV